MPSLLPANHCSSSAAACRRAYSAKAQASIRGTLPDGFSTAGAPDFSVDIQQSPYRDFPREFFSLLIASFFHTIPQGSISQNAMRSPHNLEDILRIDQYGSIANNLRQRRDVGSDHE